LIVIDASVLTDFLLGRPQTIDALDQTIAGHEHEALHAPELIEPETLSALRGLVRGGKVTQARAGQAVADLAATRLIRYPHAPLRERVWQLCASLSAYDATYLALAEVLPDPLLLTADRGLAHAAAHSLGPGAVLHLR
jgi:predicted nucleic acid-binding protein